MIADNSMTGQEILPSTLRVHRFASLQRDGIVHGITTRTNALPLHGNFSYMVGDDPQAVSYNRSMWARAIGLDPARLVLGRQVHESTVAVVDEAHAGSGVDSVETSIRRVDGLITETPNLPIGVVAADCVPILLHDPVNGAIGAIHAGWRGTVDGIVDEAVRRLRSVFSSDPREITVGLGPAICQSCYQVGPEVIERWRENPSCVHADAVREERSGLYFDLRAANLAQLVDAGVPSENIELTGICTRCSNGAMFSRRGLGPRTGLFASIIMLRGTDIHTTRNAQ